MLIIWGALLLFAACRKDDRLVDLTAVVADQPARGSAKVYVDNDRYACWHHGDAVKINGSNYTLSVTPGSDYKVAKILDVDESDNGYTAAYPASYFSGITEGGTSATVTIPSVQTYVRTTVYDGTGETYQQLVNPMVAHCGEDEDVLKFRNVACVLKVVVKNRSGYDLNVHYATLTAESAYLSGSAAVSGIGTTTTTAPSMDAPTSGSHDITVDCNSSPINLDNGEDTVIYVVSAPFENQNLMLQVLAKDPDAASHGDTVYYTLVGHSASPLSLTRNQMGEVEFTVSDCGCADETGRCDYLFWGCGTEHKPFIITNKDDLLRLRNLVAHVNMASYDDDTYNTNSVYYKQILDIDISSETNWGTSSSYAIGSTTYPFLAHYNGSSHAVNVAITTTVNNYPVGLFGVISGGASIKRLAVTGSISSDKKTNIGGLVGLVSGAATLSQCSNAATLTSTYGSTYNYGVAGICGKISAPGGTVVVSECTNSGAVSVERLKPAGICGIDTCGNVTFTRCVNDANVTQAYKTSNMASGGIVGYMQTDAGSVSMSGCQNKKQIRGHGCCGGMVGLCEKPLTLTDCGNSGTITSYRTNSTRGEWNDKIGGLVGCSTQSITINGTTSMTGNITGKHEVGGLVGHCGWYVTVSNGAVVSVNATIKNVSEYTCTTYVASNNAQTSFSNTCAVVGGVVGFCYGLTINGNVTVEGVVGNTDLRRLGVGGIVGVVAANDYTNGGTRPIRRQPFTIASTAVVCNKAAVYGSKNVGGFVGYCHQATFLGNQINEGAITGDEYYVGGLIGGAYLYDLEISGTTQNKGTVYGTYGTGGIVGFTSGIGSTFNGCRNSGLVNGTRDVGGIAGRIYVTINQKRVVFQECVNEKKVKARGSYRGSGVAGIVGYCGTNARLSVSRCAQTDTVQVTAGGGLITLGGIVGYMGIGGRVYNSYNTGVLDATNAYSVGGIVGRTYTNDTLVNCYQKGKIIGNTKASTTGTCIAGIVGESRGAYVFVNNCYNACDLSEATSDKKYGIIGCYSKTTCNYYNCYAPGPCNLSGSVSGQSIVPVGYRSIQFTVGTGALASNVAVAAINNTGAGSGSYSTLYDALTAWVTANPTVGCDNWTNETLPILTW